MAYVRPVIELHRHALVVHDDHCRQHSLVTWPPIVIDNPPALFDSVYCAGEFHGVSMPDRSGIIKHILVFPARFRPSRLRRFARRHLALGRRHAGRPRRAALQSAQPPKRHRRRILLG